jgi:enamine deaminase RidA (YjgF/YER057c/UK114 family)
MQYQRWIAGILALAIVSGVTAAANQKKKKKKKNEEEITQTLPVLPDPPPAVSADSTRLIFRSAPLSGKGLLSQQVREALKALIRDSRGASIIKIRAFVAGTGDMRRVQTILSEEFTERRQPIPALSTIQAGALPGEGVQVALEAIEAHNKKVMNPHGLTFISGQAGPTIRTSIEHIETALGAARIPSKNVLKTTCFLSALEGHGSARQTLAEAFPAAALNIVQMQRLPVLPAVSCEAVAALESPPPQPVSFLNPAGLETPSKYSQMALVGPGRLVISGMQMGFGTRDEDIDLAFDRLGKSLDSAQGRLKDVVFARIYPVSGSVGQKIWESPASFFDGARAPAITLLPFEGLPSLDASFGVEVIAAPR